MSRGLAVEPLAAAARSRVGPLCARPPPDATFFHQLGWRWLVERSFGHRAHYLTARGTASIAGVLPLFEMKSLLFGHSLVSIPFAIGGGVAADDAEAAGALLGRGEEPRRAT